MRPSNEPASDRRVITVDDVLAASDRLDGKIVRTPLVPSEFVSRQLGCDVRFKAENLQHIGAFKVRGASNAVLCLTEDDARQGVVTHSSGNHAAALARAAALRGIPAHVVMPSNSMPGKIAAVRSFGVEPVFCEPTIESRKETAGLVRQQTGATMVHPFNHLEVIAGQGTVGLEMLQQCESLDAIIAPVGGGGLLAGILTAVKSLRPDVRVYAAEPAWADDTARSLAAGRPLPPTRYDTIADGLRAEVGEQTFPVIQRLLDGLILVEESAILSAMRVLAETVHLVAEPSGAVAFAALASQPDSVKGCTVGVVISGGNLNFGACRLGQGD